MKKIKILHIINNLDRNGAQVFLINFLTLIDKTKFEVSVAFLHNANSFHQETKKNDIKVFDLSKSGHFSILSAVKLVKILKRERIDILHTHLVQASLLAKLACYFYRPKAVISTRHFCQSKKNDTLVYKLENTLSRRFDDETWAISKAVQKELIELGFNPNKTPITYNSIPINDFDFDKRPSKNEKFNIGGIGRLNELKRYKELAKVFISLKKKFPQKIGNFILIGDGEEKQFIEKIFEDNSLQKCLEITGFINQKELAEKSKEIDILIQPSAWEGFGLSLAEALALGIPSIGSNVGGIPEVLDNGKYGLLFANFAELEEKILLLINDSNLQAQFSQNGRCFVEQNFSFEKNIDKFEKRYLKALGKQ